MTEDLDFICYTLKRLLLMAAIGVAVGTVLSFLLMFRPYFHPVPRLDPGQIEASRSFLVHCKYLEQEWPEQWRRLPTERFNVSVPHLTMKNTCAIYLGNGKILIFPDYFGSHECYDGSVGAVVAHEMMHQIGLPPHDSPKDPEFDPIEIAMAHCLAEGNGGI